ncbi:FecR family protein [Lysobacter sp. CA199]|uniref:FecR family protein n=1 Tax=Lysobacter sp. CA199 TaxID=3455608 RepID=UPI003F8D3BC7
MERSPPTARIAEEALEWYALQRQGGLDANQQARFMDWLVASPDHLREYMAVGRFAAELAEAVLELPADTAGAELRAAPASNNVVALPVRPVRTRAEPPRARSGRLAIAATVVLALGAAVRVGWPQSARYVAAHGTPARIELPDGTVAHLNAESTLRIRFSLWQRRVELERGQASFVVAEDRRPLSVHAAGLVVRDIGTTFDVSLQREQARIAVTEGRVHIAGDDEAGGLLADLRAGQSARVAYRDHAVSVRDEDPDTMTAWWTRRIVFRDEALRDVADQFNRLNTQRLDVDGAAGALRLTGNLRADDLDSIRAFLDQQPSLVTRRSPGGIQVSARPREPGATAVR